MTSSFIPQILRALPTQIFKLDDAVVLRRGCTEIKVAGEGVQEAIELIFEWTSGEGATSDQLAQLFDPEAKQAVEELIKELVSRGLLTADGDPSLSKSHELPSDVFYWQFGATSSRVYHQLRSVSIAILGVNSISRHLVVALQDSGFESIHLVDQPVLRAYQQPHAAEDNSHPESAPLANELQSRIPPDIDCLVATSEIGFHRSVMDYNRLCLSQNIPFLPIVLHDMNGYIGPLVITGETPCVECLRLRWTSRSDDPEFLHRLNAASGTDKEIVGFHPTMSSVLGSVAAFEIARFFSGTPRRSLTGSLIEIDLVSGQMTTRRLLKVPRCPSCSNLRHRSSSTHQHYRITQSSRVTA